MRHQFLMRVFMILGVTAFLSHGAAQAIDVCKIVKITDALGTRIYCLDPGGRCAEQGGECVLSIKEVKGVKYWWCPCECPDAVIDANFTASEPINSFPTITTFEPTGSWTITGLAPGETLMVTATGNMEVAFCVDSRDPDLVTSTIVQMSLEIIGLPTGPNDVTLLPPSDPFIVMGHAYGDTEVVAGVSHLVVDTLDGVSGGVLGTLFLSPSESFSFKGEVDGVLNFQTGQWSWRVQGLQCPYEADIPTLTEWGLIIFGLVLLGFITWVFLRRRKAVVGVQ